MFYYIICRVGPLDPDTKYDIGAFKEGYVFTQIVGKPGHFESFKLGEISAAVSVILSCWF